MSLSFLLVIPPLLAAFGLPLFVAIVATTLIAFLISGVDPSAISIAIYQISSMPVLVTIPLFTFAGQMVAESKSPERIMRIAQSLFGHLPGGMAIAAIMACAIFTAFTGASGITIIALGGLLYPILTKEKEYSDKFTLGLVSTSGSLGLLFPPSLPVILYGLVARIDINQLYKSGAVPCLLLLVILSIYSIMKQEKRSRSEFSWKEVKQALNEGKLEFFLPIFILIGIYGGYTTVQEASAYAALYIFIIEFFIYKDLKMADLPKIVKKTMTLVGAILMILCCSISLTDYLVDDEIPQKILVVMKHYISNKYLFLMFLNVFLLIAGSIMEIFGAIVVLAQLMAPIAAEYGIDPVHFAIIFLSNLEIGYITPPFGINLFLSSFRLKRPVSEVYHASIPFLLCLFAALMVITYFPSLSHLF